MITTAVTVPSFAKINWVLHVLGKRPDGYHEIVTVLETISLQDELTFKLREDGPLNLSCDDPTIPVDHSNLVMKARVKSAGGKLASNALIPPWYKITAKRMISGRWTNIGPQSLPGIKAIAPAIKANRLRMISPGRFWLI